MFSNKMDPNSAFLDIQSGSGGTEAQDWADMLLRMYTRWAENTSFQSQLLSIRRERLLASNLHHCSLRVAMPMDG